VFSSGVRALSGMSTRGNSLCKDWFVLLRLSDFRVKGHKGGGPPSTLGTTSDLVLFLTFFNGGGEIGAILTLDGSMRGGGETVLSP
jgi:hypothetical protein